MTEKSVRLQIHEINAVKAATENMLHGNIGPYTIGKKEGKARIHDIVFTNTFKMKINYMK
jgi:hypothetical protein